MPETPPIITEESAIDALNLYDAMLERAFDVVDKAPYWKFIGEKEFAKIAIADDNTVTLTWPNSVGGYEGEHHIEAETVTFPAQLLYLSAEELATWKEEQTRLYNRRRRERNSDLVRQREAQERAVYEALKAKFDQ